MPDDGFGDYVPTPVRLRAITTGYRCLTCGYETTGRNLDPLLGMLCPQCFRRVLAKFNIPFLQPVTLAMPLKPPHVDTDVFGHPLELKRPEPIDQHATTKVYRRPPLG